MRLRSARPSKSPLSAQFAALVHGRPGQYTPIDLGDEIMKMMIRDLGQSATPLEAHRQAGGYLRLALAMGWGGGGQIRKESDTSSFNGRQNADVETQAAKPE